VSQIFDGGNNNPNFLPDYNSGWIAINAGEAKELTHNLGGNADDYVVVMDAKCEKWKIHTIGFGYWRAADGFTRYNLTNSSIFVKRMADDTFCEYIRIRIWK